MASSYTPTEVLGLTGGPRVRPARVPGCRKHHQVQACTFYRSRQVARNGQQRNTTA